MATIVTRAGKGSPLTHNEVDANFTNLNTDKIESGDTVSSLTITSADVNGGFIDGTVIGGTTPAAISGTTGTFSGNLTVDTDTLFVDAANNRVGIGTSSPSATLNLKDWLGDGPIIRLDGAGQNAANTLLGALEFYNADNSADGPNVTGAIRHYSAESFGQGGYTTFHTHDGTEGGEGSDAPERMRIDSSGRVGIGTSSPASELDVVGKGFFRGDGSFEALELITSDANRVYITGNSSVSGDMWRVGTSTSNPNLNIDALQSNGDIVLRTGGTNEAMRIDSSGNVGIGTSSPSLGSDGSGLHIKGASGNYGVLKVDSSTTSEEGWVQFSNNGVDKFRIASDSSTNLKFIHSGVAERMRIDSSGNVGIGTTSPAYTLDTSSTSNVLARFSYFGGASGYVYGDANIVSYGSSVSGANSINFYDSLNLIRLYTGGSERVRIDSAGSTFNEQGADKDFRVESDTNTHALFVDAGNSGVSINSASQMATGLHVTGPTPAEYRTFFVSNEADVTKGVAIAYDPSNDRGVITAVDAGAGWKPLYIENTSLTIDNGLTVNESSASNSDFRVESDSYTHALFVDAGNNRVSIGESTDAPNATLEVKGGVAMTAGWDRTIEVAGDSLSGYPVIVWNSQDAGYGGIGYDGTASTAPMKFWADATSSDVSGTGRNVLELGKSGGATVFNQQSNDIDFRVESDSNANMLFVDAGANSVIVGKGTDSIATTGFIMGANGCTYSNSSGNTYHVYNNGSSSYTFYVSYAGTVNYTALNQLSDEREKKNIVDLPVGLNAIKSLRPRQFDWINDNQDNDVFGFIAQEVEQVLPTLVSDYMKSETETRKGIKHIELIPVLVKAMQEQQALIEALEARIAALEAK